MAHQETAPQCFGGIVINGLSERVVTRQGSRVAPIACNRGAEGARGLALMMQKPLVACATPIASNRCYPAGSGIPT